MDPVTLTSACLLVGVLLHPALPGPLGAWASLCVGLGLLGGAARRWWALLPMAVVAGLLAGRAVPAGPSLEGPLAAIGVRVGAASGRVGDVRLERPIAGTFAPGRVRVRFPEPAPPPGTPVLVVGTAARVPRAVDGAPNPVRAAALSGVVTEVRATAVRRLGGDATDAISAEVDPTGILRALVLGDTRGCSAEDLDVLRRTGTTHLLSVSGFHVGVAALLVRAAIARGAGLWAVRFPRGLPTGAADAVSIAAAWAYAGLAGMPVPAQRAAAALSLVALGRSFGRKTEGLPALAAVAAALAVIDPSSVATASFQLSFGAMFGLVVVTPRMSECLPPTRALPAPVRWTTEATVTTGATTLATLPASAWWFQTVPPLAVPANLVAMPVLGLLAVPCGALACWGPWPLDRLGGFLGTQLCRVALWALSFCAVDPFTPAVGPIGALLLCGAVGVFLVRPLWGGLAAALVLAPVHLAPGTPRVTFLDVGQGDAALLEHPDGTRILVDGGAAPTAVLGWLRRQGIRSLDVVVQTHPDRDHAGGLPAIVRGLRVGRVWADAPSPELAVAVAERGVPLTRVDASWLWPRTGFDGDGNDRSIVFAAAGVLFTGDVEARAEEVLAPWLSRTCVLKVAHHGSETSSTPALVARVSPAVAVISVGANTWGHPAPAVVDRLAASGAVVFRTDLDGTVVIEAQDDAVLVRTGRRGTTRVPCVDPLRTGR